MALGRTSLSPSSCLSLCRRSSCSFVSIRHLTTIKSPEKPVVGSLDAYLDLYRIKRPIGIWLLFAPCAWSLQMATYSLWKPYHAFLPDAGQLMTTGNFSCIDVCSLTSGYQMTLFLLGAVAMRSAGCVINDLWDRKLDRKVERTRLRPLASGALTEVQAVKALAASLLAGAGVLYQFPWPAIFLGLASMVPVIFYPLMKRITYWPQFVLGLAFNWGALMGFSALGLPMTPMVVLPLYASGIFWTLIYDTLYAHQDKMDDVIIGIKSTALKFGDASKYWLASFSLATIGMLDLAGYMNGQSWVFFLPLNTIGLASLLWMSFNTRYNDPRHCGLMFRRNQYFGLFIFGILFMDTYFRSHKQSEMNKCDSLYLGLGKLERLHVHQAKIKNLHHFFNIKLDF